jgi:hypothetical protein
MRDVVAALGGLDPAVLNGKNPAALNGRKL